MKAQDRRLSFRLNRTVFVTRQMVSRYAGLEDDDDEVSTAAKVLCSRLISDKSD